MHMLEKQDSPVIWLLSYMKRKYYMQFADDSELCLSKKKQQKIYVFYWKNNLIFYEYFFVWLVSEGKKSFGSFLSYHVM